MHLWNETLTIGSVIFLFLALALALGFEFVNGFHDTANAVATVIYTHTLPPNVAVVWSGLCNLTGVLLSAGTVAYSIVNLLPVELVLNVGSGAGFAMVFALLLSAIIWNLGTWYFGLPASSSHTLIGAIIGVGLSNSLFMPGHTFGEGVNWAGVKGVGLSLLISPIVGFVASALLLLAMKALIKKPELFAEPPKGKAPPLGIRSLLVLTCTGVSFAHGSNDGQKGMGLIMLILIGIVPGAFALKMDTDTASLQKLVAESRQVATILSPGAGTTKTIDPQVAFDVASDYIKSTGKLTGQTVGAITALNQVITDKLSPVTNIAMLPSDERKSLRTDVYLVSGGLAKLNQDHQIANPADQKTVTSYTGDLNKITKYIPLWVKIAVAMALGFGTMIGWKRIVVTVGEKIGKSHLTYAQGASAELVAMATIGAADAFGLPVSTTHVLASGVAGTMAANRSGLQMQTLRNLVLAWVLTLPVCIFLGAGLFAAGLYVVLHFFSS